VVWGVPAPEVAALDALTRAAGTILTTAQSSERTKVVTADCKAAFKALVKKMRLIKKRFFLVPPLTHADLAALGLKPRDATYTPAKTPVNQAGLEITIRGLHLLGVRVFTAVVMDAAETGYGVRIYFGLVELSALALAGTAAEKQPSATRLSDEVHLLSSPPLSPADLPDSFFTRRTRDLWKNLPPEASGKMCYLAARYETSKGRDPGPWGTMISAIVP
jgi:hypothetical protein